MPVQANGIASYFPTLPSNGQASKQFSAPRPASRVAPSQTPFRHSCLGKRSNADAAQTDELQPATSGEQAHWSGDTYYWQVDCMLTSCCACITFDFTHPSTSLRRHPSRCKLMTTTAAQMRSTLPCLSTVRACKSSHRYR